MISNSIGSIIVISRIRLLCVPVFLSLFYGTVHNLTTFSAIYQSLMPWQAFISELSIIETLRLLLCVPLVPFTLYLGYRCIANEFDEYAIELNRELTKHIIEPIQRPNRW